MTASRRVATTTLRHQLLGGFLARSRHGLAATATTRSRLILIAHYGAPTIVRIP